MLQFLKFCCCENDLFTSDAFCLISVSTFFVIDSDLMILSVFKNRSFEVERVTGAKLDSSIDKK